MKLLSFFIGAILASTQSINCYAFQHSQHITINLHQPHRPLIHPTKKTSPAHRHTLKASNTPLQDLQTIDTEEGNGAAANFESIVTVQYAGRILSTNKEFDSGIISFKLGCGKVLKGCDMGIRGMRVGGTRVLRIPFDLGFGSEGFDGPEYSVPAGADLEYTVKLTAVAEGAIAEAAAKMGIGLDPNTVYLK